MSEQANDADDMEDVEDDMDDDLNSSDVGGSGSDVNENGYMNDSVQDINAAQARGGKDIQGIPWGTLNMTRDMWRQNRLEEYGNYGNIAQSGEGSEKECKTSKKQGLYYDFRHNSRSVKSTIFHFQFGNMVWATSKHDVYFMSHSYVMHWSSLTYTQSEVLDVSGHVAPCEKHPGSLLEGFTHIQVSSLAVKDNLLVGGGTEGELICKYLDRPGISHCTQTSHEDDAINNAVEIYTSDSGAMHFIASNDDCGVRDFDMEKFQEFKHFYFPWPVYHTSPSPDGKQLIVVGDNPDGMLVDCMSGKIVASLHGHLDHSFASAWHPTGLTFATANQDKTCQIWDIRYLSRSLTALKGNLGAFICIRFTSDGKFLAMAEPEDFVHVYDVESGYEKEQEIDFFGEVSGISFSPDTESLFVGVWHQTYNSFLEFGRHRKYDYLDALF